MTMMHSVEIKGLPGTQPRTRSREIALHKPTRSVLKIAVLVVFMVSRDTVRHGAAVKYRQPSLVEIIIHS